METLIHFLFESIERLLLILVVFLRQALCFIHFSVDEFPADACFVNVSPRRVCMSFGKEQEHNREQKWPFHKLEMHH